MTREERIQQIRDCGQSIMDKAETIYGDYEFSRDLEIVVTMEINQIPEITVKRKFIPEAMFDRLRDL